jgi:hypothetical protein
MNNEWLRREEHNLKYELKKKNKRKVGENLMVFKLLLITMAVFFCKTTAEAKSPKTSYKELAIAEDGHRQFHCAKCGKYSWHHKNTCDWQGYFYCSCGNRLGK